MVIVAPEHVRSDPVSGISRWRSAAKSSFVTRNSPLNSGSVQTCGGSGFAAVMTTRRCVSASADRTSNAAGHVGAAVDGDA